MLSEDEISEVDKFSKKSEAVGKLLEFWKSAQVDGESAIRIALNNKWLEFSKTIDAIDIPISNHERNEALNSLIDITKLWKGIAKGNDKKQSSVEDEESKEVSVADRMANKKRKDS